ncbi:MAG: protease modulator HflC [Thermodesulfobacteriota bacterium]
MRLGNPLLIWTLVGLGFLLGLGGLFVVDEREQVIVTQFGRPVGKPIQEAGLYFKWPLIQQVNRFPKTLLEWDGDPGQIPTLDKTFIWLDAFARWRIQDPLRFFQTVGNETWAQKKLDDIIDPAVRNAITSHLLIEAVRNTNRDEEDIRSVIGEEETGSDSLFVPISVGRHRITEMIQENAAKKLLEFGIELVDVRIKRILYVEEVQKSVFARMIQERKRIAEKIRSEGKREANIIEGNKARKLAEISSQAYREAQEIKGRAEAEAARIYAQAYSEDPEFYGFLKSMEVYSKGLDQNSTLVLDTRSELWRYLKTLR